MADVKTWDLGGLVRERKDLAILAAVLFVLAISIAIAKLSVEPQPFPTTVIEEFAFAETVNGGEKWLRTNYRWLTRAISGGIRYTLDMVETFLILLPWPVVVLGIALPALSIGGLRLGLFCVVATMFWGFMDMWDPAMETLSLMAISVVISVVLGVLIGIVASQSNAVESVVRPVLDTMQTMPAFVYLIPAVFFFGIGGAPAILATIIYALPPAVRLTSLGIRQVDPEIVEAARSFGSTGLQLLLKVKLPLALPSIMMGINQSVMMALALVVLATFIGAAGLGYEVWQALRHLNIGWSLEGGVSIVLMAIIFDRISYAMSEEGKAEAVHFKGTFKLLPRRLEGQGWAEAIEKGIDAISVLIGAASRYVAAFIAGLAGLVLRPVGRDLADGVRSLVNRHVFLVTGSLILVAVYLFDAYLVSIGGFPSSWQFSIRGPADAVLDWLVVNQAFIAVTTWIRGAVFSWLLDPLADFLVALPWWYTIGLVAAMVWLSAGRWLALVSVIALMFIGAVDLWPVAMFTLASILVSVFLCFLMGVPLGVLAACSNAFDAFLRPILDAMQTMPAFVYLVPVLMFFGGNVVSAVIATVIYAVPPVIRLTTLGIRGVPPEAVESARSFGSTFMQTLVKVRLPLALPSIMMGINQAVMMALAMTVITPLIGGGGLGEEVFRALAVVNTGLGLEAGLSIVFLAIVLDRVTQAWSRKQQEALGLQ